MRTSARAAVSLEPQAQPAVPLDQRHHARVLAEPGAGEVGEVWIALPPGLRPAVGLHEAVRFRAADQLHLEDPGGGGLRIADHQPVDLHHLPAPGQQVEPCAGEQRLAVLRRQHQRPVSLAQQPKLATPRAAVLRAVAGQLAQHVDHAGREPGLLLARQPPGFGLAARGEGPLLRPGRR